MSHTTREQEFNALLQKQFMYSRMTQKDRRVVISLDLTLEELLLSGRLTPELLDSLAYLNISHLLTNRLRLNDSNAKDVKQQEQLLQLNKLFLQIRQLIEEGFSGKTIIEWIKDAIASLNRTKYRQ